VKLAVSNIAWAPEEDELAAAVLSEHGVRGIELAPTLIWPAPVEASERRARDYADGWRARGFEIVALQSLLYGRRDLQVFGAPEVREATLAFLGAICRLAGWLGAGTLVFGSPTNRHAAHLPAPARGAQADPGLLCRPGGAPGRVRPDARDARPVPVPHPARPPGAHGSNRICSNDLLSGTAPQGGRTKDFATSDAAREAIYALSDAQVAADLDAVAAYALKLPASNGKLAVGGFCWGGGQTFRYATHNRELDGAFVFYGAFEHTREQLAAVAAPVYGFHGGNDERINGTIPATSAAMRELGKSYEPVTYEGAGHGFMRSGEDPQGTPADKKARDQAWERWRALLKAL